LQTWAKVGIVSNQYEEYRRWAMMCKELAVKAAKPELRADWLEMIPLEHRSRDEAFLSMVKRDGTRQEDRTTSH
jgi:hypothetical protein